MRFNKFTVGILVGAAIGVLFAPTEGNKSRKKICDLAGSLKSKLDNLFDKEGEELVKLKELLEDEAEELTEVNRKKLLAVVDANLKSLEDHKEEIKKA